MGKNDSRNHLQPLRYTNFIYLLKSFAVFVHFVAKQHEMLFSLLHVAKLLESESSSAVCSMVRSVSVWQQSSCLMMTNITADITADITY